MNVLITGGTSGIGREFVRLLSGDGNRLFVAARNSERLAAISEAEKTYATDLSSAGAAKSLHSALKKDGISVDMLINNAGFGLVGPSHEIDIDSDVRMLNVNMIALTELCKLFIADMYEKGSGYILNVASTGAFQPGPYTSTYFASKAYVLSYSRALWFEAKKRGVNVCALCPGTTKTEFFIREGVETPKYAMEPEKVAAYGLKRLMAGRATAVPGMVNKLVRLVPSRISMAFVARLKLLNK